MQHYRSLDDVFLEDAWLAIGSFDGVHLGHQEVLKKLVRGAHATGSPAVVITFHPHPAVVLGKRQHPFYLTTPEERAALLGALGVDVVITQPFNRQVASLTALEFMTWVRDHLHLSHLIVGPDFALGRGREGNIERLSQIGEEQGYTVEVAGPVSSDGDPISSSAIRKALDEGDVERAARLLGRPYCLSGKVIHGDGRGKSLGIPTANLDVWAERAIPKNGIYVCHAHLDGLTWGAVTNIGFRPTFDNQPPSPRVEALLLDFDQDIYGQEMELSFIARLRDEVRYSSVQDLLDQIKLDIQDAREILAG